MGASKRRKAEIERRKRITTGLRNKRIYHGTVELVAQDILNGGTLRPRGDKPSTWDARNLASRKNCVYLTDLYGVHYAMQTIIQSRKTGKDCPKAAVIEMDYTQFDRNNFLADEDFMAMVNWAVNHEGKNGEKHREEYEETVRYYVENDAGAHKVWLKSLLHFGTVAHRGDIPRNAITRIAIISAPAIVGIRYETYKDDDLWKVIFNPTPDNLTQTQQFQGSLTHTIFDTPHPEVQVIRL